jgi:hypothetical protein
MVLTSPVGVVPRYPPFSVGGAAVTVSDSRGLDVIPDTTALRLVDPAATPVTRPPELTVAMVVAELVQVDTALPWESVVVQVVADPSE